MANDADIERLAYDAAMVTEPNSGVPVEFTSYLDPRVIEILTGPRNSREIFAEVKKATGLHPMHVLKSTKSPEL